MAFLSYYAMSTGYGWTTVSIGNSSEARQFFYARYIDWAVTTPLLLVRVGAGKQSASEPLATKHHLCAGLLSRHQLLEPA